jgi:hypothetical protein
MPQLAFSKQYTGTVSDPDRCKVHPSPLEPHRDGLLTIPALARRWRCCNETARQRAVQWGLTIVRFNKRSHAVRLSEVLAAEQEAAK